MTKHHSKQTEPNGIPMAHALSQKRDVRDLNTRLEMYVRAQTEKKREIVHLKKSLTRCEVDYKNEIAQNKSQFEGDLDNLRKENSNLAHKMRIQKQDYTNALTAKRDYEERLIDSMERNAVLTSENGNIRSDLARSKEELDHVRKEYATIKYKFDSYSAERTSFKEKMTKQKRKNEQLVGELNTFDRVIIEKNDEINNYRSSIEELEIENKTIQSRLRKEFDNKLSEFIEKREDQYKEEKDEWMRIFKEEFNRKMMSFKEANHELSYTNIKQSQEITDLSTKINKLKQQKAELKLTNSNYKEEIDKLRTNVDDLRRTKDNEIKLKNELIINERGRFKAKELQFDELAAIKLQLDSEIELYRNILNEAEQECGYTSPLIMTKSRKRKKLRQNKEERTPSIGIEGGVLQFSALDLNKGMIEIQNLGEESVHLNGYVLSNNCGTMIYDLPKDMMLESRKRLRIYVGEELYNKMCADIIDEDFIGDYNGAYVFWGNDVWKGNEKDCARLYNPSHVEIASIQLSPAMIDAILKSNV